MNRNTLKNIIAFVWKVWDFIITTFYYYILVFMALIYGATAAQSGNIYETETGQIIITEAAWWSILVIGVVLNVIDHFVAMRTRQEIEQEKQYEMIRDDA